MIVLHINSKEELHPPKELRKKYKLPGTSKDNIIDDLIKNKNNVFILIWMEGCGPCNATKPEWFKLESALKNNKHIDEDLVIVDVNQQMIPGIKNLGNIEGFPTMKYFSKNGKQVENYEDSSIRDKDRSIDSFINWIESNITEVKSTNPASNPQIVYNRLIKGQNKKQSGGKRATGKRATGKRATGKRATGKRASKRKWSRKYKLSIDCKRPKGFSQKQYCKYGRNKTRKQK